MVQTAIKKYILDKPDVLSVEYIETQIKKSGFEPLRWAIVDQIDNKLTVEAVVLST